MRMRIRSTTLVLTLLFLLGFCASAQAERPQSVYEAIENQQIDPNESQSIEHPASPSNEPTYSFFSFFVRFLVSLAFIIFLIYFTLKFWSDRTKGMQARGPFLLLGGCSLGGNRSLQAVMIGKTVYILGVGENVQLIRQISEGEEYDLIVNSFENQTSVGGWRDAGNWFKKKERASAEKQWEDQLLAQLEAMENNQAEETNKWLNELKKEGR